MDCMQACEVISAAHDGELVDAAVLAAARAHAEVCEECAIFVRVLDRIASTPGPEAPPALVARIGEMTDAHRPTDNTTAPERTRPREWRDRERFTWLPRVAALASAAAVLLVVVSAGGIVLFRTTMQTANEESVKQADGDEALMAAPSAETAEDAASARAGATAAVPAFVSLDAAVWTLTDVTDAAPSDLGPAGSVMTSLGGSVNAERSAFHPGDDRSLLYVTDDDGGYHVFSRVVRTLGGADYGLVTGTPIGSFGVWPTLPGRFGTPARADGSPVFEPAGYDDLHVGVFLPPGGDTADGFALAPGTTPDDPAAGNPGWTWWEPFP